MLPDGGAIVHVGPCNLELPSLRGGAVERRMVELAVAQRLLTGREVVVYSPGRHFGERPYAGMRIRYLAVPRARRLRRVVFARRVAAELSRRKAWVIHVHNQAELALVLRRTGYKGPIVLSRDFHLEPFHDKRFISWVTRGLLRLCMRSANLVAVVSRYCLRLHTAYWGLPRSRFAVLHNGVNTRQFTPNPAAGQAWRSRLGVGDAPVLLYVGRLCHQKGTDVLLEAYARLRAGGGQAVLVLAGPGETFDSAVPDRLRRQICEQNAIYLPPVLDEELAGLYNACDIFVMPTRELEMFGMAAVEAQACGKPVVASDHGGLRETVPLTAGLRFRTGCPTDLAQKLRVLLSDPDLRARLARGALANARQYDWLTIARQSLTLYERVATKAISAAIS